MQRWLADQVASINAIAFGRFIPTVMQPGRKQVRFPAQPPDERFLMVAFDEMMMARGRRTCPQVFDDGAGFRSPIDQVAEKDHMALRLVAAVIMAFDHLEQVEQQVMPPVNVADRVEPFTRRSSRRAPRFCAGLRLSLEEQEQSPPVHPLGYKPATRREKVGQAFHQSRSRCIGPISRQ